MKIKAQIMLLWVIVYVVLLANSLELQASDDIIVIAHLDVSVDTLKRSAISEIYRESRKKWINGDTIRVVMLKRGATHETFVKNVVGTTPAKLKNIWKKVVFTGAGIPPKIFKQEADLVEFIAETKGAIGYINSATSHEGVKVITVE